MKIFITAREYSKQERYTKVIQEQLEWNNSIDTYKNDLIGTLKTLLAHKEEAIDHLKGQLEELKR